MNIKQLETIVYKFREIIELSPIEKRPLTLQNFPNGACGDATILLGQYLIDLKEKPFRYMCGWLKDSHHVWLQRNNLIIDITADQFDKNIDKIIVSNKSEWHKNFRNKSSEHDAELFIHYPRYLHDFYKYIINDTLLSELLGIQESE